jgi:hypothetical protein
VLKASSNSTGLPLNDEDSTTKLDNGWKKVNTLRHYNVKDGTALLIVARIHNTIDETRNSSGDNDAEDIVRNVHGESIV